ncbi:hypothetical protein F2B00_22225 [Streptomyces parvus]|uniref:hypothetical protein n=1 Tax=Streptomyces parvus TaxID=66428 RepID=UPI00123BFC3D|nr:hypothetical protein [Streptomyces parvus]KAA6200096.1 hypothetical protein F2B00_22225 [Streptomyces parvus]GGS41313.1 hypothetical protein GCM10010221_45130 [Streptomyces parvus]
MPDTTPADRPADRPADLLRAAADRAPDPALAGLLTTLADASDHHTTGEYGAVATVVHPALAVARQLLGTTSCGCPHPADEHSVYGCAEDCACEWMPPKRPAAAPAPADRAGALRDRIADALAAADGWEWGPGHDSLTSSVIGRYLRRADAVLAALAADAAAGVQPPTTTEADTALAAAIPEWEAVYEPGNVSDYLIGYANTEAAAKGAAIAWVLSQSDKTADRLEWTPTPHGDNYDEHFELSERHDDGVDTGVGVTVRHRLHPYTAADFAPEVDEEPAAPAAPEEPQ